MVWIDLTDLFEWRGHFTGIQRVAYNYAQRFQAEGAKYFVYSNLYNRFIEIPFSLIIERDENYSAGVLKKRQKIKRKLKNYYEKLPKSLQDISEPTLRRINKIFRKLAARLLDHKNYDRKIRRRPSVKFSNQDTVLLLGAGWNSGELIDELITMKYRLNLKVILHLNDILPLYQPHLFAEELPRLFSRYVNKALKISDLVTVISKATKIDVQKYCTDYKLKEPKIEVIRLGENITTAPPAKPNIYVAKQFILCVGTFEIRKNYILIYQALKLAESEGRELPQIVIAGRKGWLTNDLQYVIKHDPSIFGKIILLEKMSDENLSWLYENCMFTVFCSLAEGWGLPIAESLQHGKFCLSSNTSSMPEIAGYEVDYFSPYDPRSCLEKILLYVEQDKYKEKNKHLEQAYKTLSWDDSFRRFKAVVEDLSTRRG